MSASHRLNVEISCSRCRASALLRIVEDADPPFTDTPRRTYRVDLQKFVLGTGESLMIECVSCGYEFPSDL
jgi:hypothetical protein